MNSIKCIVTGDGNVGKTSLLLKYTTDNFPDQHEATVFDSYSTQVCVSNTTIDMVFYDTAGQEDYDAMRPLTYGDADIFFLCYECMTPGSFENIKSKWLVEKNKHAKGVPFMIVGTKIDLRNDKDRVKALLSSTGRGPVFAADLAGIEKEMPGCVGVMECSAKTAEGLREVFNAAITHCILSKQGGDGKKKCAIL